MYCTVLYGTVLQYKARLYKVECRSVPLPGRPEDSLTGIVDAFEAPTPP